MAGIIPPEIVEQVRHASDIVDVIGGYVPLKKAGAKFKALSPFNKEKTPSFYVDPTRQMFKCFSSGHGGDVFKFLMLMENMTFPEAIRRLAQRAGIPIPESGGQYDPEARTRREELHALYAAVASWWHKLLKTDPAAETARAYLKSRDFPDSLVDEFALGYAPDSYDATMKWARKAGYSQEALETGKLVAMSERGTTYDFFRGRLMIPIHNDAGEVVAFSGRLLDPEAKAQKYVNSPETPIFVKSRILFGLNKTKRPIIEAGSAILCEGQIDLMRCWQHGIRNVVAPQGTAFTDPHARILKRIAKEVVICFDADRAGQAAAQRTIDVLLKEDLQVRIARIPQGEDPDSLLRKQPVEVFATILREAKDYTRHLLDTACEQEDFASPQGRGRAAQKIAQVIAKIPNPIQQERITTEAVSRLQVPIFLMKQEILKAKDQLRRDEIKARDYPVGARADETERESEVMQTEADEPIQADIFVAAMLSLLLKHPEMVPQVCRQLNPIWIKALEGSDVLLQLLDAHAHDSFENATQYLESCDDRTRDYLAGLMLMDLPTSNTTEAEKELLNKSARRIFEEHEAILKSSSYAGKDTPENMARSFIEICEKRWKQQRLQFLMIASKSSELSVEERMKFLMEIQVIRRQFPDLKP